MAISPAYANAIKQAAAASTPEERRTASYETNYRIRSHSYTENASHAINFKFKAYRYGQSGGGTSGFSTVGRTTASVSLPLPTNLQDSFSVQVGAFEMGSMGALAADALSGADVAGDIKRAVNEATNKDGAAAALSSIQAASTFFARNALDELGFGGIAGGISVAGGTAINPHVALKFDGVDMKSHTFVWNISPKNAAESAELSNIIAAFKKAMLPSYGLGGNGAASKALLEYPDIVEIGFSGLDTTYFYKFKKCMIKSFNVNYTPNGPGILQGGKPGSVQMELSVTEAEVHTKEDYI